MKRISVFAALFLVVATAHAEQQTTISRSSSAEFRDAAGRVIGTVTKIGGITYYAAADGTPLGTSTVVAGERVYSRN